MKRNLKKMTKKETTNTRLSRRKILAGTGILAAATMLPNTTKANKTSIKSTPTKRPFSYCLNTSTIMGQQLGIVKEIELAAKTGFDGIEIWVNSLDKYLKEGGTLSDLKKRINDLGIQVENAIGFAQWIVDDNDVRSAALEQAKREMDWLQQIGCSRIAAPPAGATEKAGLDLMRAAERFRALVDLGDSMGVIPQLEIWGFSANLNRLSQVLFVAAECGHPKTRILPDIYHLYKGGSDIDGLKLLHPKTVEIFHVNDYPDKLTKEAIGDKDRVHLGEGIAPVASILKDLYAPESTTILSLELFNRDYWKQDAKVVAETGLRTMKMAVQQAME